MLYVCCVWYCAMCVFCVEYVLCASELVLWKFLTDLTFVYPCIVSIIVNDDQQDANVAYLFIPNQLYMFRAMPSPIIRSTRLYLQLLILSTDIAAGWCHG